MNRARILPFAVGVLAGANAHAWESACVTRDNGTYAAKDAARHICDGPDSATACSTPQARAAGIQVGEHSYLAARILAGAGLAPLAATRIPSYLTASTRPGGAAPTTPGTPSSIGGRASNVRALTSLPEFAEVPDASYGLSDFLSGNEHCFARGAVSTDPTRDTAARSTSAGSTTCHDFSSRMGSVNSTHFGPQARASYNHYHSLALEVARR